MNVRQFIYYIFFLFVIHNSWAQEKRSYNVFQFPADQIPRIDGNTDDWDIVPESYTVSTDQLWDDSGKHD